jgi:Na+/proline symporter
MTLAVWTWLFFAIFLALIAYLTVVAYKRTASLTDYTTASRSYGPGFIALAFGATSCSAAATMGNPGLVAAHGWPALWYGMGGYGGVVLAVSASAFLLSRIGKNAGAKSMPDFLAIRFNSPAMRVITAIFCISALWYVAGQLVGVSYVFSTACGTSYVAGLFIAGIVIAVYMSFGGTHADIINCFVQGLIMAIFGAVVTILVIVHVGGIGAIDKAVTAIDPSLSSDIVFKDPYFGPFTGPAIFIGLALFGLTPQLSKMWLALKDERLIPRTLLYLMIWWAFMAMLFWFGGLGSKALFPEIEPDKGTVTIITTYLPEPIAALLLMGIIAAVMSTTGTLYLMISVAIAVDIYRDSIAPLLKSTPTAYKLDRQVLMITRILIPIVMGIGILIAINPPKFLTGLMWVGLGAFIAGVIPPMIVGCLWRRTTKPAAIIASISGFLVHVISYFIGGAALGITICKVPWFGAGLGMISSFGLAVIISLFTKPLPKEYLDPLYLKTPL